MKELTNQEMKFAAKPQCPNCGADLKNVVSTGGPNWLFGVVVAPILLLGFLPALKMTFFKPNPTSDLEVIKITRAINGRNIDISGVIRNGSKRRWTNVSLEIEFFNKNGDFMDEDFETIRSSIKPNSDENFKCSIPVSHETVTRDDVEMRVKVADALSSI